MAALHPRRSGGSKTGAAMQCLISLALAVVVAAAELEVRLKREEALVSPNLMKNGLGVTVPGTEMGCRSCGVGALGGNANAGLEVLETQLRRQLRMPKHCWRR